MAKQKQKTESVIQAPNERVYKNDFQIKSDLFKLELSTCNLNKAWNEMINLESVEHVHFFHTYDSDGKKHTRSQAVAGHFHIIEWEDQGTNKPAKILSVSGPMREVKRRVRGRWTKVVEPIDHNLEDNHTHDITYRKTDHVKAREVVSEAVNIAAQEAQKTAPIPGVSM